MEGSPGSGRTPRLTTSAQDSNAVSSEQLEKRLR